MSSKDGKEKNNAITKERLHLESSFVAGLVNRLLSEFKDARPQTQVEEVAATIVRMSLHRINIVATELEKVINEKTFGLFSSRVDGNLQGSVDSAEELFLVTDVLYRCLYYYQTNYQAATTNNEHLQIFSRHACGVLISTIGSVVFYQSQYLSLDMAQRLHKCCGRVIGILSEMNEEAILFHVAQIFKKCLDPQAESKGTFYTLRCLQYFRLRSSGVITLLSMFTDAVTAPGGAWKKAAMLEISYPLRCCIFTWLDSDPTALEIATDFSSPGGNNGVIYALLLKLDPWVSGAKKRSAVWTVMNLLCTISGFLFQRGVNGLQRSSASAKFQPLEAKILRKTLELFSPSTMQSVLQKDSHLLTEVAALSLLFMYRFVAILQRHCNRVSDATTKPLYESYISIVLDFIKPHLDRLQDMVFSGNLPSSLYYNAMAQDTPTAKSEIANKVEDLTPDGVVTMFIWSRFYCDTSACMQHLLRVLTASSATSFARIASLRALLRLLPCDYTDKIGQRPTWRMGESAEVRAAVLGILSRFIGGSLSRRDYEREFLLNIEAKFKSSTRPDRLATSESSVYDPKTDIDALKEVLRIIAENPWFVFVRRVVDEQTGYNIVSTAFTSHLSLLFRDLASCLEMDQCDDIPSLALEALIAVLQPSYMSLWTPKDPFYGSLNLAGILMKHIAFLLLRCDASQRYRVLRLQKCLYVTLLSMNDYLGEEELLRETSSPTEAVLSLVRVSVSAVEAALLVHYCSSDPDIIVQTALCLNALCTYRDNLAVMEFTSSPSVPHGPFSAVSSNIWAVYREMSTTIAVIPSPKLQQKSIRAMLSTLPDRSIGMQWALAAVMHRWTKFNAFIKANGGVIPSTRGGDFEEWANYMGFLCALGSGVSASDGLESSVLVSILAIRNEPFETEEEELRHNSTCSEVDHVKEGETVSAQDLVKELLSLVLHQYPDRRISQTSFIAVGMFLAPSLLPLLFRELMSTMDRLGDVLSRRSERGTTNPIPAEKTFVNPIPSHYPLVASIRESLHRSSATNITTSKSTLEEDMSLSQLVGFVNSMLTMLQLVFDRDWQKSFNFHQTSICMSGDDIANIVEMLFHKMMIMSTKLLSQIDLAESEAPLSQQNTAANTNNAESTKIMIGEHYRLKRKLADVLETFMVKKGTLVTSTEFNNCMVSLLMDWTYDCLTNHFTVNALPSVASSKAEYRSRHQSSTDKERSTSYATEEAAMLQRRARRVSGRDDGELYRSTELACVKAMCELLRGLEITWEEDEVTNTITSPGVSFKAAKQPNVIDEKSKKFFKYFHILQNVLSSGLDDASKHGICSTATEAICHLLHANMNIGFRHLMEAACSSDNQPLRAAFLNIFTEVLSRRSDFAFGAEQKIASYEDTLHDLSDMLNSEDRLLLNLLCMTAHGKEADEVAQALISYFEEKDTECTLRLLHDAIGIEVTNTPRLGSLFRSETMGTKLMGAYFSHTGREYLLHVLCQPISEFIANAPEVEVDPNKGVDAETIARNAITLQHETEKFLVAIVSSVAACPVGMRRALKILREEAARRFDSSDRVAVVGYIFLRFFCPAIAMPQKYGILRSSQDGATSVNKQATRGLLLIAKILQNLANGTHFLEECMHPLNTYIDERIPQLNVFCQEISNVSEIASMPSTEAKSIDVDTPESQLSTKQMECLTSVHRYLHRHKDAMNRLLTPKDIDNQDGGNTDETGRVLSVGLSLPVSNLMFITLREPLLQLIKRLGEPPDPQRDALAESDLKAKTQRQNSAESDLANFFSEISSLPKFERYYENLRSKAIFYAASPTVFVFVIRRVESDTDASILLYIILKELRQVMQTRRVLKKMTITTRSVMEKTQVVSAAQISEKLPLVTEKLPRATMSIESGPMQRWQALLHDRSLSVALNDKYLILESSNKFGGVEYKRTDILSLLHIENISGGALKEATPAKREFGKHKNINVPENTIVITYIIAQVARTLKLVCANAKQFVTALSAAVSHVKQKKALDEASKVAGTRTVNAAAIPGMLLHLCFLNFFSNSLSTRQAAYVLLSQMKDTYHLPLTLPLLRLDSIVLPCHPSAFALAISSELAASNPEYAMEFIVESIQSLRRPVTTSQQKIAIMTCLRPWLSILATFFEHSRVNDTIKASQQADMRPKSTLSNARRTDAARRSSLPEPMVSSEETPSLTAPNIRGRVFELGTSEMRVFLEELFEICIDISCADDAISHVICEEFWEQVAKLEDIAATTVRFFMKRWYQEIRDKHPHGAGEDSVSVLYRSESLTASMPAILKQSPFDSQADCIHCLKLCNICAIIARHQPHMISGYLSKRLLKLLMKMIQREKTNLLRQCITSASVTASEEERPISIDESIACSPPVDLVDRMSTILEESDVGGQSRGRVDSDMIMRCWVDGLAEAGLVDGTPKRQKRNRSPMKTSRSSYSANRKDDVRMTLFNADEEDETSGDRAIDDLWLEVASLNAKVLVRRLPDVIHGALSMASHGPANLRPAAHMLLCSLLHSVIAVASTATDSYTPTEPTAVPTLEVQTSNEDNNEDEEGGSYREEFIELAGINISLWRNALNLLTSQTFLTIFHEAPKLTPNNLELIVVTLVGLFRDTGSAVGKYWKSRLWSLCLKSAMAAIPGAGSSSFVLCLEALVDDADVTNEFVTHLLRFLGIALEIELELPRPQVKLVEHTLRCLSRTVKCLEESVVARLFWLAVMLLQMTADAFAAGAIKLLHNCVSVLLDRQPQVFLQIILVDVKNSDPVLVKYFGEVERCGVCGMISFDSHFSVSLTLLLLPWLTNPSTADATRDVLKLLMSNYMNTAPRNAGISGYSAILLPIVKDGVSVSQPMGCYSMEEDETEQRSTDSRPHAAEGRITRTQSAKLQTANSIHYVLPSTFFLEHNFNRNSHAVLFATCLLTFFRSSQIETEKIFALNVLLQMINEFGCVLHVLYDVIFMECMVAHEICVGRNSTLATAIVNVLDECVTIKTVCDPIPEDALFLPHSSSTSPRLAITTTDDTSPSDSLHLDEMTLKDMVENDKGSRNSNDVLGGEYLAMLGFSGLFDMSKRRNTSGASTTSAEKDSKSVQVSRIACRLLKHLMRQISNTKE